MENAFNLVRECGKKKSIKFPSRLFKNFKVNNHLELQKGNKKTHSGGVRRCFVVHACCFVSVKIRTRGSAKKKLHHAAHIFHIEYLHSYMLEYLLLYV